MTDPHYHYAQGGYADDHAVYLEAGQTVTFLVRGGPTPTPGQRLDVVATLLAGNRELASDDDGAGFPDARLTFTARRSGVYGLRVTSFGGGYQTGAYTIQS